MVLSDQGADTDLRNQYLENIVIAMFYALTIILFKGGEKQGLGSVKPRGSHGPNVGIPFQKHFINMFETLMKF